MKPAARLTDKTLHPLPGMLSPGPGSPTVLIGNLPAWRGILAGAVPGLQAAKAASDVRVEAAKAATMASAGTPGFPAAKAAEEALKAAEAAAMGAMITSSAGGADIHVCATMMPLPPPHGPGVVIDGSTTVFINNLPACRMGDTILEGFGPPNKIVMGLTTVLIGDGGGGGDQGAGTASDGSAALKRPTFVKSGEALGPLLPKPEQQAAVLRKAAKDGTPFCEICNR